MLPSALGKGDFPNLSIITDYGRGVGGRRHHPQVEELRSLRKDGKIMIQQAWQTPNRDLPFPVDGQRWRAATAPDSTKGFI